MQILPTSAATSAAGNVAQATSRDRGQASSTESTHLAPQAGVDRLFKSEGASPDRDAQGAGDGLGDRNRKKTAVDNVVDQAAFEQESLPARSPEPPSQIDLLG